MINYPLELPSRFLAILRQQIGLFAQVNRVKHPKPEKRGRTAAYLFGIVLNFPLGALALLGLARSYALVGDAASVRTAYRDFLTLWKDADPLHPHPETSQSRVREIAIAAWRSSSIIVRSLAEQKFSTVENRP